MIGDHDTRRHGSVPPGQPYAGEGRPFPEPPFPGGAYPARSSALRRFLGGSPAGVLVKLVFLSVLVGAGMAMLGVTPGALFLRLADAARALIDLGLDTFHDFGRWILAGAAIVVPVWLVSRFLAMSR